MPKGFTFPFFKYLKDIYSEKIWIYSTMNQRKVGKYEHLDVPPKEDCWICLEEVAGNAMKGSVPTCRTCVNAHYVHDKCYHLLPEKEMAGYTRPQKQCGLCFEVIDRYCYTRMNGYTVPKGSGGGKTRKGNKKARKNKKSTKSRKNRKLRSMRK